MVTPNDIDRAEAHDRNRYFSERFDENEDKGEVLTLHKQSKAFKNKIKSAIENNCYWISNSVKQFAETDALDK